MFGFLIAREKEMRGLKGTTNKEDTKMEYEIYTNQGTFFAYGKTELEATLATFEDGEIIKIWKNIKRDGSNQDITSRYIK